MNSEGSGSPADVDPDGIVLGIASVDETRSKRVARIVASASNDWILGVAVAGLESAMA